MVRQSLWVREDYEKKVEKALKNRGFGSQSSLRESILVDLSARCSDDTISQATISHFMNGVPIRRSKFQLICEALELNWEEIAVKSETFISYCKGNSPDESIAQALSSALRSQEIEVFPRQRQVELGSHRSPEKLRERSLERCDYFIVLLSVTNSTIVQDIEKIVELRTQRPDQRPEILVIPLAPDLSLPSKLATYLQGAVWWQWESTTDTPELIHSVLTFITEGHLPPSPRPRISNPLSTASELLNDQLELNEVRALPSFTTPLERPDEGLIRITSNFYIERPPIESECYDTITQPGALIRIKAPRQMGKTSLMERILHHASKHGGSRTAVLNFQLLSSQWLTNLDTFWQWFCAAISAELQVAEKVDYYWSAVPSKLDSNSKCKNYFEQYLFKQISEPITIGLDEVDRVFEYPAVFQNFFGLLRALNQEAKRRDVWGQLRLVLVHSTEVYVPMPVYQSPFNVGLAVSLPEFTPQQVQDLVKRHELEPEWGQTEIAQLMALVGGHPFLIRLALYRIARRYITLQDLTETAIESSGVFGEHLRHYEIILSQHPELADALQQVIASDTPVVLETSAKYKLNSLGLINLNGEKASIRCNLYRQYFQTY